MELKDFLDKYSSYAFRVDEETGMDYRVVLAQWSLESGMGRNRLALVHNNPGSIKYTGNYGVYGPYGFASYSGLDEFVQDYIRVMNLEYYAEVLKARDPLEQIRSLQASPYDEAHYPELLDVYQKHFERLG